MKKNKCKQMNTLNAYTKILYELSWMTQAQLDVFLTLDKAKPHRAGSRNTKGKRYSRNATHCAFVRAAILQDQPAGPSCVSNSNVYVYVE